MVSYTSEIAERYTDDPFAPCIRRASNEIQSRVKKWWDLHNGCCRFMAIVSAPSLRHDRYAICGDLREVSCNKASGFLRKEELVTLYMDLDSQSYGCLRVERDTSPDYSGGPGISDWLYPDEMLRYINQAIMATSGLPDNDLAKFLGVTIKQLKGWMFGDKIMPASLVKMLTGTFVGKPGATK